MYYIKAYLDNGDKEFIEGIPSVSDAVAFARKNKITGVILHEESDFEKDVFF